jgi:hypothetical protein
MRLKFSKTKYDASLIGVTTATVWASVAWVAISLLFGIGR